MKSLLFVLVTLLIETASLSFAENLPPPTQKSDQTDQSKIEAKTEAVYQESHPDQPANIYSRPCPFDCNSEGFSHAGCKEWKEGKICFIGPKELTAPKE